MGLLPVGEDAKEPVADVRVGGELASGLLRRSSPHVGPSVELASYSYASVLF